MTKPYYAGYTGWGMAAWQPERMQQMNLEEPPSAPTHERSELALRRDINLRSYDLGDLAKLVHECNYKWWHTADGLPRERNVGEMLMLAVSELAEALEGHRKGLQDDHLPARSSLEVELADCLIRVLDMAQGLGLDLAGAFRDKMLYNLSRSDHSHEARQAPGGKAY